MKQVVVLACDGELDVELAIAALARVHAADVVTVTIDIGQARGVRATRDAALASGAARAHVFDGLDDFVRLCVLPALQTAPASGSMLGPTATLAYPVIAARLVDVAHLEHARVIAHGGGDELSEAIRAVDPSLQVCTVDRAPALEAPRPPFVATAARHLLQRPVADPDLARGVPATVEIEFDAAVPVAINGVTLTLGELVESLSLIGGEHGIGHAEDASAPGALLLDAAYRALDRPSGVVRIELLDGRHQVVPAPARTPQLVNHA